MQVKRNLKKVDNIERIMIANLNLGIYENYKNLHGGREIRQLFFADSEDKQYEYGYSNLTTLYQLYSAHYYLSQIENCIKKPRRTLCDFFEFRTTLAALSVGFFVSLKGCFDSMAHELHILFNNGSIDDKISFNGVCTSNSPTSVKNTVNSLTKQLPVKNGWYYELNTYRNIAAHQLIMFLFIIVDEQKRVKSIKFFKPDLCFSRARKLVHPGIEKATENDFLNYTDLFIQCSFYFNETKEAIEKIWKILFQYLKEPSGEKT